MKVVQVLNHFLPQQAAGTEVYTWALSKRLQQNGVEVEVVIPNYGEDESARYTHDGLSVFQYAEPSIVDRSLVMGFRSPDGLREFESHLASTKPDVVHFHELAGSNGIGVHHVRAAKRSGAKVVMTFHLAGNSCKTGTLFYKEKEPCDGVIDVRRCSACYLHTKASPLVGSILSPLSFLLYKAGINTSSWQNQAGTAFGTAFIIDELAEKFDLLVESCDRVIVIAKWYGKILVANGVPKNKISYVAQGLPFDNAIPTRVEKELSRRPVRFMFLGRIDPLKGLHLLLEAVRDIPDDKFELDIFGQPRDEAYEKEWRNRTAKLKSVKWKGRLRQEDVVSTMKQYDALCLCSTFSEMSPLVIQEAFAAGIPVIASSVYGNAEQISHGGNGLIFHFKDSASLRHQLLRCIGEPGLLQEMKRNIRAPRSFAQVADEYLRIYQTLVTEGRG